MLGPVEGDVRIEAARKWAEIMRTELEWSLLVIEFRVHAARDDALNARYAELHERAVASLAENVRASLGSERAPRHERLVQFARVALASSSGAALARAAEGEAFTDGLFEEIIVALTNHFAEETDA
jgi:hypothetical protein